MMMASSCYHQECALIHYQHSLKNGVFSGWRQFVHVRHVRSCISPSPEHLVTFCCAHLTCRVLQHRNALRYCSVRLLKRAWSGWASAECALYGVTVAC